MKPDQSKLLSTGFVEHLSSGKLGRRLCAASPLEDQHLSGVGHHLCLFLAILEGAKHDIDRDVSRYVSFHIKCADQVCICICTDLGF